jgi:hypothetical protein
MRGNLNEDSLKSVKVARLSALADFERTMAKIGEDQKLLKEALLEAVDPSEVPAGSSLPQFFAEHDVIDDLFRYGKASRKIVYSDDPQGFANATEVRQDFNWLKEDAWKNSVKIEFSEDGDRRIEIFFQIP